MHGNTQICSAFAALSALTRMMRKEQNNLEFNGPWLPEDWRSKEKIDFVSTSVLRNMWTTGIVEGRSCRRGGSLASSPVLCT